MPRLLDALLGPFVPLSFGRPGLWLRGRSFAELARLDGRHAIVTGANSGIGRAATEALVALGARVTMVCRDSSRAELARDEIVRATSAGARLAIELCDVARQGEVAALAARLVDPIDIVIHNAGVLPAHEVITPDGIELTWATHVVGPHLLMRLLRPRSTAATRHVLVSSGGMYLAALPAPGRVPTPYDGVRAYAETKRAQVALATLWAEHDPEGPRVVAMHPGWANTTAVQTSLPRFHALMRPLLRAPGGGADTLAWLGTIPIDALVRGGFYFDRAPRPTHVLPWGHDPAPRKAELWRWLESITQDHVDDARR